MFHQLLVRFMVTTLTLGIIGCTKGNQFSTPSTGQEFKQRVNETVVKVDVLWVVDSSGSMETSQANVAANFQSFIDKFQTSQFDFQMAVASTDAWVDMLNPTDPVHDKSKGLSRFSDLIHDDEGKVVVGHTGVHVMTSQTANLTEVFQDNIQVGVVGNSDERGLQSLIGALENQENIGDGFPRKDALLAVIFVSDEDDFSHDGEQHIQNPVDPNYDPYTNPVLHPVSDYYDYLFDLTESSDGDQKFIVNSIAIQDEQCLTALNDADEGGWKGRYIGRRYNELADLSSGYKGNLCDDFSDVMSGITDRIIEFTTRFSLAREPLVDTIEVFVDGVSIPQDILNGWTYDANTMSVVFHGDSVPPPDSLVQVSFDPAGLVN